MEWRDRARFGGLTSHVERASLLRARLGEFDGDEHGANRGGLHSHGIAIAASIEAASAVVMLLMHRTSRRLLATARARGGHRQRDERCDHGDERAGSDETASHGRAF